MTIKNKLPIFCSFLYAFMLLFPSLSRSEMIEPTQTLGGGQDVATLSVFSEPPGLAVFLDDTDIGNTPVHTTKVKPGLHVLKVEKSEAEIYILPGKSDRYSYFKGKIIEIPEQKTEITKNEDPVENVPTKKKIDTDKANRTARQKEDERPLYWPLNPRGPMYGP